MSKKIAKSPEMIAQEALVKELVQKIKRTQTTLKTLKTKLGNTKQAFLDLQVEVETGLTRKLMEAARLVRELTANAKTLSKAKYISSEDKIALKDVTKFFEPGDFFGVNLLEFEESTRKRESGDFDFEEDARAQAHSLFDKFHVAPPQEEQREIRKVFIALSSKFHPDKAKNDVERVRFHELMQEINAAYQNHDIQALLDLQTLNTDHESLADRQKAVTVDSLTAEADRLQRELNFLENQVERTSEELNSFRQSDFGKALTEVNREAKAGFGLAEQAAEVDDFIELLEPLCAVLEESIKQKRLSPSFFTLLMKWEMGTNKEAFTSEDMEMFDMMMDEDFDLAQFLGDIEPLIKPKFKMSSWVEVTKSIEPNFYDEVNYKGMTGEVVDGYSSGGVNFYIIRFDTPSLQKLPHTYFLKAYEELPIFDRYNFSEANLKKAKAKRKETKEQLAFRQELEVNVLFNDCPDAIKTILHTVLVDGETSPSVIKWYNYFQDLKLPVKMTSRGLFQEMKKGTRVTLKGMLFSSINFGIIADCLQGRTAVEHPLIDLKPIPRADKHIRNQVEAHYLWMHRVYLPENE